MGTFHIPDMSCDHCKATVEKAIHTLDPDAQIDFDMEARRIKLDTRAKADDVTSVLAAAGYSATIA